MYISHMRGPIDVRFASLSSYSDNLRLGTTWSDIRTSEKYGYRMSAGCSTASQHSQNTEANVPPPPLNKKYSILVDIDGAKGKDAMKRNSRCGALIRGHISISYEDWRKIDKFYKDHLWKALMKEFEMNIDPKKARPILEKKFPQYFRTVKATLRKKYLKKDDEFLPRRLAIDNRPDDVDKVKWETFVDNEYSEKKRKQCKTNAENKGKNTITHTLGRKYYTKLYDELEMENPDCKPTRAMAWKMAHKNRKIGEVLPCEAEKHALIEEAEERQKSEARLNGDGEDGIISLDDFEKDHIAEVFGDNKRRSYCRAISSTANVKQVKLAQASKEIIGSKENVEKQWKKKMENNRNQMHEDLKSTGSVLSSIQQCMNQIVNRIGGNMTPTTEVASNAERAINSTVASLGAPSNGFKGSSMREKQSVILLSRELKEIANGYLGMQKICHHREVVQGEKVV